MSLTLKQAALLLVRFFGFYLLFYAALGIFDAPGYWLRSSFSHPHSGGRSPFETSSDVGLLMYYFREAAHFIVGLYLFRQPRKLAELLARPFEDDPKI